MSEETTQIKNQSKRPIGIVLIIVFNIWAVLKGISSTFFQEKSIGLQLWTHYKLLWLHYFSATISLLLTLWLIYLYIKRKKLGYTLTFYATGFDVVRMLTETILAYMSKDMLADWYLQYRMERGFPITPEKAEAVANPTYIVMGIVTMIVISLGILYYIYRKRAYFSED